MATLKAPVMAGFNAGKNYFAKMVRVDDVKTDPEISGMYKIQEVILEEIYQKMLSFGFDESQPVVLQKGTMILLDGHTRLAAAKKAGLTEIPAVEKEFKDRESAVLYTFERQALRRNLTGAEILFVAQMMKGKKEYDGTGREAELLAKRLNVGVSSIYRAKAILSHGDEEIIQAVRDGDISIKKGYNKITNEARERVVGEEGEGVERRIEFPVCNFRGLPASAPFLRSAVILLIESGQKPAAGLLINHFLKKQEKEAFFKQLPESVAVCCSVPENGIAVPG